MPGTKSSTTRRCLHGAGTYAWYFDAYALPDSIPIAACHRHASTGRVRLYVGIAPAKPTRASARAKGRVYLN
jgi:hypothetical protein